MTSRLALPLVHGSAVLVLLVAAASARSAETAAGAAAFVDESGCVTCHQAEHAAWTGSHHDLAMQDAGEKTVLGDFTGTTFEYAGVTSRFFRKDGRYFVTTDGPNGKAADFEIRQVFGVEPLQQYLIEIPGGSVQALSIAWDTKAKRWFHLYPNEKVDFRDELHWTRSSQNWNHQCGECHATGYRKNYDEVAGVYRTSASRFDVGCQGCHGPASRHAEWAGRAGAPAAAKGSRKADFDVDLGAAASRSQIEVCAQCHSRRATLFPNSSRFGELMDAHLPSLLDDPLYYADGQVQDEVYVYGSFVQSRMHAKGVRCSDCHDPHSGRTRGEGNALCVTCHSPAGPPSSASRIDTSGLARKTYDSPSHHFHPDGSAGAQCIACHAPVKSYMVVDPRHDHSFRIPRPDLASSTGAPDACTGCHFGTTPVWAAEAIARWYGPARRAEPHYGTALANGRRAKPGAVTGLVALVEDRAQPAIVRATAVELLAGYPGASAAKAVESGLGDPDALVRRTAASGLEPWPAEHKRDLLLPLLSDPVRAVRIEAARLIAPSAASLEGERRKAFDSALAELDTSLRENADQADSRVNEGNSWLARGDAVRAETAYRKAIAIDPAFVPAYVNLADVLRGSRAADAEKLLREGLAAVPDAAALHESLGLLLVGQGRKSDAMTELAAAASAAPDVARYAYVYAVALHDAGRLDEALRLLEAAAERSGSRDVLLALISYRNEKGDPAGAAEALRTLKAVNPDDPVFAAFAAP